MKNTLDFITCIVSQKFVEGRIILFASLVLHLPILHCISIATEISWSRR